MTPILDCLDTSRGEWRFRLFGTLIRVQIWFWFVILIMGGDREPLAELTWVAVCFVSILLHELGHVAAFRLFRVDAEVVLHGWGGLAIPHREIRGAWAQVLVSLAGPAAGFGLAGVALLAASQTGFRTFSKFHAMIPSLSVYAVRLPHFPLSWLPAWTVLLNDLLWVNFYWGLMNLLPVYPLDGGQAARSIFERYDSVRGRRRSLIVSAVIGGAVALFGLAEQRYYLVMLFGLLAVSSIQALELRSPRQTPRPYGRWNARD